MEVRQAPCRPSWACPCSELSSDQRTSTNSRVGGNTVVAVRYLEQLNDGEGVTFTGDRHRQMKQTVASLAKRSRADVRASGFRVGDIPNGDSTVFFVSPDAGETWPLFCYFPTPDPEAVETVEESEHGPIFSTVTEPAKLIPDNVSEREAYWYGRLSGTIPPTGN